MRLTTRPVRTAAPGPRSADRAARRPRRPRRRTGSDGNDEAGGTDDMDGSLSYLPAAAMAGALALRLPALLRDWRDPLVRPVCALIALSGAAFLCSAPTAAAAVDRLTGTANASAVLASCLLNACGAACLVLLAHWRGGTPRALRRTTRRLVLGHGAVITGIVVLFLLGDAPAEGPRDLDTYYATAPYLREMIVLHLVALAVAVVAMIHLCRRWARRVRGWLRAGLTVVVVGHVCVLASLAARSAAVAARWYGGDLDALSSCAAPVLASVGAQVSAVGFALPLAGPRLADGWAARSAYHRLGPLWRELRPVSAHRDRAVRMSWWTPAGLRVVHREAQIHDGMLALYPYFDAGVRAAARAAALAAGSGADRARAEADAAMVVAALRARTADPEGRVAGSAEAADAPPGLADGPRDLVRISLALRRSPVVAAVRGRSAARPGSGVPERAPR
ncbi:hypothetical protein GCM10010358_56820 [Streptomyces minutiscleroticus]|uniref:DUF6545 domain-containing protein n=2 Tax=Streptomyces minutiscleroticus TaxID=68238 RepID=A0A918U5H7_9ACTN|nr:hypothetical protein GCM10010358_56820 [Streptomyces minutiscleroticus]